MNKENRVDTRYDEIARVIAPEICVLPGVLDNISASGCKIHFPLSAVNADVENEYEIKIIPSRLNFEAPLNLMCVPQWIKENADSTEIGFKILYSPDAARLAKFIEYLDELSKDELPDID